MRWTWMLWRLKRERLCGRLEVPCVLAPPMRRSMFLRSSFLRMTLAESRSPGEESAYNPGKPSGQEKAGCFLPLNLYASCAPPPPFCTCPHGDRRVQRAHRGLPLRPFCSPNILPEWEPTGGSSPTPSLHVSLSPLRPKGPDHKPCFNRSRDSSGSSSTPRKQLQGLRSPLQAQGKGVDDDTKRFWLSSVSMFAKEPGGCMPSHCHRSGKTLAHDRGRGDAGWRFVFALHGFPNIQVGKAGDGGKRRPYERVWAKALRPKQRSKCELSIQTGFASFAESAGRPCEKMTDRRGDDRLVRPRHSARPKARSKGSLAWRKIKGAC